MEKKRPTSTKGKFYLSWLLLFSHKEHDSGELFTPLWATHNGKGSPEINKHQSLPWKGSPFLGGDRHIGNQIKCHVDKNIGEAWSKSFTKKFTKKGVIRLTWRILGANSWNRKIALKALNTHNPSSSKWTRNNSPCLIVSSKTRTLSKILSPNF